MSDIYVGGYWSERKESARKCAVRLALFLQSLSECDSVFSEWYETGNTRRHALRRRVDCADPTALIKFMEGGRHLRDTSRTAIDDLGFHIGVWNGAAREEKEVGVSVTCGLYTPNPNLRNCVVINLPEELGELQSSKQMTKLLAGVAKSWDPDWAGVISRESRSARGFDPAIPFVDWMLYISHRLVPNPTVPEPCEVKPINDIGSLIVVEHEPPKADNPTHLQRVRMVESALGINK